MYDTQKKCEQYWPEKINGTLTFGSELSVTLMEYVPFAEYQIRKLKLQSVRNIL